MRELMDNGRLPAGAGQCEFPRRIRDTWRHREDVQYEDFKGHKLDRKMLELIKEFSAIRNSKQRVLTAWKEVYLIEYQSGNIFSAQDFKKKWWVILLSYYDGKTQVKMASKLGIDAVWIPINGFCGIEDIPHEKNEVYRDEWGVTYKKERMADNSPDRYSRKKSWRLDQV